MQLYDELKARGLIAQDVYKRQGYDRQTKEKIAAKAQGC